MDSGRLIRNGYMGLVVKIANLLNIKAENSNSPEHDEQILEYLESIPNWYDFKEGELATSNENNSKTLGGNTTRNKDYEDDKDE